MLLLLLLPLVSEGSKDAVAAAFADAFCFFLEDISFFCCCSGEGGGGGIDCPEANGCWKTSVATAGHVAIEQFRHKTLQTRCGFLCRVTTVAAVTEGRR